MASEQDFSWRRCLAWAMALGLHAAVLLPMSVPMSLDRREFIAEDAELPRWIDRERVTPVEVPIPRSPSRELVRSPPVEERRARRRVRVAAESPPDAPDAPVPRTIAYLDDDARARLPNENLYAATPPPREGDYYTPGNGSEDDVFYRPRALDPNPSRFAYAWRPRGNLIDEWLGRAVEKVSGKVTIPLNAKFSLVCGTVAGVAGGCAIVRNAGTGVIVQRPPPAPWERSNRVQCRELRAALDAAEEAAQVAYFLDRLSALCSEGATNDEPGNDEARREAGLPEDRSAGEAPPQPQRAL